jgi:hypothetical protein
MCGQATTIDLAPYRIARFREALKQAA